MKPPAGEPRVRFAELMACLAAACELAMGQDADRALRTCGVSMRLASAWGLRGSELRNVYYQALLRFVGCNAQTEAMSAVAGDVIALRRAVEPLDPTDTAAAVRALLGCIRASQADSTPWQTALAMLRGLAVSGRFADEFFPGHCEVAERLGRRLGFDERFVHGLGQLYARWDGRGVPAVRGEAILPAVRVVMLAHDIVVHAGLGGWEEAAAVLAVRRGGQHDPALVDLAAAQGAALIADLPKRWDELLALEPPPYDTLEGDALDDALRVLADYAEIQLPWLANHSARVASLAAQGAAALGLDPAEQRMLRRAAWVHDIGRVGISAHLWSAQRHLSQSEHESLQMHSLFTARILDRAAGLRPLARLAGSAHERIDASGYPRRDSSDALPLSQRILAAADVVAALGEPRPYRDARSASEIETIVAEEVRAGRLDRTAARAVCDAAGLVGPAVSRADALPAGLSLREAQVLGELARGLTNKEIARRLGISPKTVGHQVQSVYRKAGVATRAGATLFAIEHGLVARHR